MHAQYGFSLTIHDIDPSYTLGELERERRQTIERLVKEGLMDKNKQLELPIVVQRIAVVSSKSAAGYEDFIHQINNNSAGYHFNHELFTAIVQGESAPKSILEALKAIVRRKDEFDAVVIIRGGGSKIDLRCFDSYEIASAIAWMKLPVITGIGHERDDSVTDMVAHTKCKTPTAVAEFIIELATEYEEAIIQLRQRVIQSALRSLNDAQNIVERIARNLKELVVRSVTGNAAILERLQDNLRTCSLVRIQKEKGELTSLEEKIILLDPINVIKRGYSLVYATDTGTLLRDSKDISVGGAITINLAESNLDAKVTKITLIKKTKGMDN
jgi:exodeoxyribonuclease VII large subunit